MTGAQTRRADQALVADGLARSRRVAAELIRAGRVRAGGRVVRKPSAAIAVDEALAIDGEVEPWVGRAAYKLLHALDTFDAIDPRGLRCIDVGASTGGFTQVLLRRGAREIVAIDVGHGQLAREVGADARVRDLSGLSIRDVVAGPGDGAVEGAHIAPADLVVCDLSFISLRLVLPTLAALTDPGGDLVSLVKPQFEVGRERLGHGGIVRSATARAEAVEAVVGAACDAGLHVHGLAASPITGAGGNREYLLWARHEEAGKMAHVHTYLEAIRQENVR